MKKGGDLWGKVENCAKCVMIKLEPSLAAQLKKDIVSL